MEDKKMKMHFYINGWEEGASKFMSYGFTWEQIKDMAENGTTITKDGNKFQIELS